MPLLTAGYWLTTYWLEDYWIDNYWSNYGVEVPAAGEMNIAFTTKMPKTVFTDRQPEISYAGRKPNITFS